MDIKSIITCPICHTDLDDTLRCPSCNTQYSIYHGVYDIVNRKLSENQKIFGKYPTMTSKPKLQPKSDGRLMLNGSRITTHG